MCDLSLSVYVRACVCLSHSLTLSHTFWHPSGPFESRLQLQFTSRNKGLLELTTTAQGKFKVALHSVLAWCVDPCAIGESTIISDSVVWVNVKNTAAAIAVRGCLAASGGTRVKVTGHIYVVSSAIDCGESTTAVPIVTGGQSTSASPIVTSAVCLPFDGECGCGARREVHTCAHAD
jgi:hypothetical protein